MLGVADARFSGGIRYRKRPPTVRGASERRTGKGLFLSGVCCIRCGQCSPFSGSLKNSVPERAFSGTEYARGAKNRLLWYATHFQRHSVRRTGFCGTEEIFGTGKALLWYGGASSFGGTRYRKPPPTVRGVSSERRTFLI